MKIVFIFWMFFGDMWMPFAVYESQKDCNVRAFQWEDGTGKTKCTPIVKYEEEK